MNLIRDLEGNEYPLQATITYEHELNGNQNTTFTILPSSVNDLFIDNITEMWEFIDENEVEYKIVYCKKQGTGGRLNAQIKAIPLFFDRFDTDRVYEEHNQHMTAQHCFNIIFQDTEYNVVLNGTFEAIQWEGFGGGDTRLNMFKNALNRYKAEFRIVGNTIYVENLIGRDTQFMYRYKLNASNIVQENDASAYWTYAKGYGDFAEGEWQDANLIREYTSPIASIIGKREAPPIKNGNITTAETMDSQLKTLVDDSLKISVSADIHDLEKYPLAQPMVGDRAFLMDERIGLETEIRVQHLSITKDWKGNVLNLQAQFGSPNIVKRHQSNLQTAISNIQRLLEGNMKLPFSVLDDAVLIATKALQNAQTELQFPESGGILAIDKTDPNFCVLLNSAGLGVSNDGGATFENAITGHGINANVITVGTMLFDRIMGGILTLGGLNNGNGRMQVLDENGEVIADLDAERGGFSHLNIGDLVVTEKFEAPGVVMEHEGGLSYYVSGTPGSDDATGTSWETALYSASEAIRRLPKFINGNVTVYFRHGYDINENLVLLGFSGGGIITIDLRDFAEFRGFIKVASCSLRVRIINGTITRNEGNVIVDNESSPYVEIINLKVNGNGQDAGIRTWQGGKSYITDCEVHNVRDCLSVTDTGHIYATDNRGHGSRYGIFAATGAVLGISGAGPKGDVSDIYKTGTVNLAGATNYDEGTTPPPAPPVTEKTQVWSTTASKTWRPNFGGQWGSSTMGNDVLQGQWGEYGLHRGYWFFGSSPRNSVNGKRIKRIRVRLKRANNSGYSNSVNAIIRPHGYASQPSGQPSYLGTSHSVGFKWGERKWVTLPSSFHSYFQNGSAYGIMIYTTSTNNANYMRFEGSAEIEITWEE